MKILWLVLSTLFLHQAVAMKMVREPAKEMSEIAQVAVSEKVKVKESLGKFSMTYKFEY